MSYGIIYKATNKVNGKVYIGQTIRGLSSRKSDHISTALRNVDNFYFHNSIRKYGSKSFKWETLCECSSLEDLNKMEKHYIDIYDTFESGYNMTIGGEGTLGHTLSEETKKLLSYNNKGRKLPPRTEEWCKKISSAKMGGKLSPETIYKRTATRKSKNYNGDNNWKSKKYVVTLSNNKEVVVFGLRNFCKSNSIKYKSFHTITLTRQSAYKGYKCRHYNPETDGHLNLWEIN
jgi:group I intron endonuclease